jgi:hypothetical protein
MRLSDRTRTALAMTILPLAVLGILARNILARTSSAGSAEPVEAPADWVPFQANVTITNPDTPAVRGRYYRASDGSERLETGPSEQDIRVIMIRNFSERVAYLFSSKAWTREPIEPLNGGKPLQWRKGSNWIEHPYRLALRRGESGSLTADVGLFVYRVATEQGVITFKAPELNLFDVIRQRPDGRYEVYSEIDQVEPPRDVFAPPVGVSVQDLGRRQMPSQMFERQK